MAVQDRVAAHRARLRAEGLRPVQLWVPDVRVPAFQESARRASRAVAASPSAEDDMAFVESLSVDWDE